MSLIFSGWPSGSSIRMLSTLETEGRADRASCLRRSSSRFEALASAAKPDRPALATMRSSHSTDSTPLACSLSML
jgi:hypothetical protein